MGKSYCGTIDNRKKDKKQCDIHVVSQAKRTVCPKCGDYGWIYNEDATSRKVCPCHY